MNKDEIDACAVAGSPQELGGVMKTLMPVAAILMGIAALVLAAAVVALA